MSYTEFQNLNLSDDFLFAKVMEDEAVLRPVVEKILDIRIREMTIVQSQRMIEIEPDSKGIRLDIMADDVAGSRYTVEMQNENEYNINKRSRYYHSMMDQIVDGRDEGARCHSRVDLHLIEKERHDGADKAGDEHGRRQRDAGTAGYGESIDESIMFYLPDEHSQHQTGNAPHDDSVQKLSLIHI